MIRLPDPDERRTRAGCGPLCHVGRVLTALGRVSRRSARSSAATARRTGRDARRCRARPDRRSWPGSTGRRTARRSRARELQVPAGRRPARSGRLVSASGPGPTHGVGRPYRVEVRWDARRRTPYAPRLGSTAATWPVGIALTSWHYMWRTTPHAPPRDGRGLPADAAATDPAGSTRDELQGPRTASARSSTAATRTPHPRRRPDRRRADGHGRSRPQPRGARPSSRGSSKTAGDDGQIASATSTSCACRARGTVRCASSSVRRQSLRLATLAGHLEAGQIEFRGRRPRRRRSSSGSSRGRAAATGSSNLLYHHLRMAKEIQLHMWISFLERVVGAVRRPHERGIEIETERIEDPPWR